MKKYELVFASDNEYYLSSINGNYGPFHSVADAEFGYKTGNLPKVNVLPAHRFLKNIY